jgi:hypothetical protein
MVGATERVTTPGGARVVDLRGLREPTEPPSVLADPSGRRARRLHAAGRIAGSLLLLWLCGLVLAGLGLLPVSDVPLAETFRPADEPAKLSEIPSRGEPSDARLRPVQALAEAAAASAGSARGAAAAHGTPSPTTARAPASRRDGAASRRAGGTGGSARPNRAPPSSRGGAKPAARPPSSSPAPSPSPSTGPAHSQGQGTTTPPASSSGIAHGKSDLPHGAASSAPGHTRTNAHGQPAG